MDEGGQSTIVGSHDTEIWVGDEHMEEKDLDLGIQEDVLGREEEVAMDEERKYDDRPGTVHRTCFLRRLVQYKEYLELMKDRDAGGHVVVERGKGMEEGWIWTRCASSSRTNGGPTKSLDIGQ